MKYLFLAALLAVTVLGGAALSTGGDEDGNDQLVASTQTIGAIADTGHMIAITHADAEAFQHTPGFLEVTGADIRVATQLLDDRSSLVTALRHALMPTSRDHAPHSDSATFTKLASPAPNQNVASSVVIRSTVSMPLLC